MGLLLALTHLLPMAVSAVKNWEVFSIKNQNDTECPPQFLPDEDNIFAALKNFLDPSIAPNVTRSLRSSVPHPQQKASWTGGHVATGEQIMDHTFGCKLLPLRPDRNYSHHTIAGRYLDKLSSTLIPKLNRYSFFNHTGIQRLSPVVCAVSNCDTIAVAFYPLIVPITWSPIWTYIYGFAYSQKGNLVSKVSGISVWDGTTVTKFKPKGHLWVSTIFFLIPPAPLGHFLSFTPIISIFGGKGMHYSVARKQNG
jgi:hypothetical protein